MLPLRMKVLYGASIGLSAFLLFSVEPMAARALLPTVGGSAAMWITALAFFQVALLAGYGYAAVIARASMARLGLVALHLGFLGLAALSLVWMQSSGSATLASAQHPQGALFLRLASMAGLPFLALSTTSPLMQAWYARREQEPTPYRLFGFSNLSSLAALLAYPSVLEPYLRLSTQFLVWKIGFVVYLLLAVVLTVRMRTALAYPAEAEAASGNPSDLSPTVGRRWLWFSLPAAAAFQLAAVTSHLTQDVASMPLLWVIPLAAYLLSFVLAFQFPGLYRRGSVLSYLGVLLFALGWSLAQTEFSAAIGVAIVLFTAELFLASWFCHAELYALRPQSAAASTHFYLLMAAGGAAGTLAVAVVLPLLTESNFDLPVAFLLTAVLVLAVVWEGMAQRLFWLAAAVCAVVLLGVLRTTYVRHTLFRQRNFYGSLRVVETQSPPQAMLSRTLYNGHTEHGMQWFSDPFKRAPLTYYAPDSGVGLALEQRCAAGRPRRIGVIGLGAGTLAAYGRAGDTIRFYEINPLVTDVAQHLFTYTRDTPASVAVVPGDARLSLAAEPSQNFDVLVVDAFSGDSIPTHLLTREALALYRRHLVAGGVLAFHISNQYLDLAPVLARLAEGMGPSMAAREIDSAGVESRGESLASWVLLTDRAGFFDQPAFAASRPIATASNVRLWTDEYSSLLPVLHWAGRRVAVP